MYRQASEERKSKVCIDNEYQYAVVQFLELPYSEINDFICVPHSWIQMRRAKDRKTTVAFPNEPSRMTENRIKKCEDPLETWKVYMAIIKYESYSYIDANLYIMEKKMVDFDWNEHSAVSSDHEALLDMAADITYSFKQVNLSEPRPKTNKEMTPGYANVEPEPTLKRTLKKMAIIPTTSFRTSPRYLKRNINFTLRKVGLLKKELLQDFPELNEDFTLFCKRLKNAPDEPKQEETILKQQSCVPKVSIRQNQVQDFGVSTSFAIQNQTNASSEPESLVYEDYLQAMSTQTPPRRNSEVESMSGCPNSEKHQYSSPQAMIIDESTEASCNEQPEKTPENNNFAEEINGQSYQPVEEEEAVTNEVSIDENDTEDQLVDENEDAEADQPVETLASIKERWRCHLTEVFIKMDYDFSHACEITLELHQSFLRTSTVIKRIKSLYESYASEEETGASVMTPQDVGVYDEETAVEDEDSQNEKDKELPDKDMDEDEDKTCNKKPMKSKSDDENDDGLKDGDESSGKVEDDEDKQVPKKTRMHIRTFVLPPEYNPNDSRWTLKYCERNAKRGLVELLPGSKVYIDSIRLTHCKRVAKDSKTLARMLLVEIFTQSALSVCSLTGARANAFEVSRTKVRPGLDEHARMVMLNFVEEHARRRNWGVFHSQSVINSIRSKIQEMRAKYSQTE